MSKKKPENQISEEEIAKGVDRWRSGIAAVDGLRQAIADFKTATGEADVSRVVVNQFLSQLDSGIGKLDDIFKQ